MQSSVIYYLRTECQLLGQSFCAIQYKTISATDFRNLLIISDTMNCNCADNDGTVANYEHKTNNVL